MPEIWEEGKDLIVDLSHAGSKAKGFKERAKYSEYDNVDLASGYPKDMIWKTADGRRIAIPNLIDDHLLNILSFVRRNLIAYKRQLATQVAIKGTAMLLTMSTVDLFHNLEDDRGEVNAKVATLAIQKQIDKIMAMDDEEFIRIHAPIYSKLYQEAYKRKIILEVDKTKLTTDIQHPDPLAGVDKWTSGS